jgi:hypothetical protein
MLSSTRCSYFGVQYYKYTLALILSWVRLWSKTYIFNSFLKALMLFFRNMVNRGKKNLYTGAKHGTVPLAAAACCSAVARVLPCSTAVQTAAPRRHH